MNDIPTISAAHFMAAIAANVDNHRLSDTEFREFIRDMLTTVGYQRKTDNGSEHTSFPGVLLNGVMVY